jgi:3-deoxy-manno-octulosonate cytidylyltransferase (CMP-KDO synthetase)
LRVRSRAPRSINRHKQNERKSYMKIIGVIPARYASSRFPGKPLADIHGKPMIWWVYQQVIKVPQLDEVYVATDDSRIYNLCQKYEIKALMTGIHNTHIERIHELSTKISSDYYVNVNGDEPLIEVSTIQRIIPEAFHKDPIVFGLLKIIKDPVELVDPTNIKVATNKDLVSIMMSRSPIPTPYKTILFDYRKTIGMECFNKSALDFFVSKEPGYLEMIEDISPLRFLENGVPIHYKIVESDSLSVDTPKDLDKVRLIMERRLPPPPP